MLYLHKCREKWRFLAVASSAGMMLLASGAAMAADVELPDDSSPSTAEYFVRPYIRYGGSIIDGIERNDSAVRSESFTDGWVHASSDVNIAAGTIKNYLYTHGPDTAPLGVAGAMGDVITYTGAEDVAVNFSFSYDAIYYANLTPPDYVGDYSESAYAAAYIYFAIYEAGSDATWDSWTTFSPHASQALYNDYVLDQITVEPDSNSIYLNNGFDVDLFLKSGKSYNIYASFGLDLYPGDFFVGGMELDGLNTSTIGIASPGGSFTSLSGQFLGYAKTPDDVPGPGVGGVPEPATWAMLIAGFGIVGVAMRRRRQADARLA